MKKYLLSALMLGVSATMFAASTAMIRLDIISDANADSNDKVLLVENSAYSAARDQSGIYKNRICLLLTRMQVYRSSL